MFILSSGNLPVAVMLLKIETLRLSIAEIPFFYMIYNVSYASFSLPAGATSDQLGARGVIASGYVILLLSYLLLAEAHSMASAIGAFLVLGLFPALTDGVERSAQKTAQFSIARCSAASAD